MSSNISHSVLFRDEFILPTYRSMKASKVSAGQRKSLALINVKLYMYHGEKWIPHASIYAVILSVRYLNGLRSSLRKSSVFGVNGMYIRHRSRHVRNLIAY